MSVHCTCSGQGCASVFGNFCPNDNLLYDEPPLIFKVKHDIVYSVITDLVSLKYCILNTYADSNYGLDVYIILSSDLSGH